MIDSTYLRYLGFFTKCFETKESSARGLVLCITDYKPKMSAIHIVKQWWLKLQVFFVHRPTVQKIMIQGYGVHCTLSSERNFAFHVFACTELPCIISARDIYELNSQ